jgi:hypothetical protein
VKRERECMCVRYFGVGVKWIKFWRLFYDVRWKWR